MGTVRTTLHCAVMALALAARPGDAALQRGDPNQLDAGDSSSECRTESCRQQEEVSRAAALIQQGKNGFVTALLQFTQAIAGRGGDEGRALPALLDAMAAGLARWDEAIRRYETALLPAAASVDALVARAAVYLDRSNTTAALKEIEVAGRLAPGRLDVALLRALAHDRAGEFAESARAFESAASIAPREAAALYGLAQARIRLGDEAGAREALQTFDARFQQAQGRAEAAAEAPFPKLGLVRPVAGLAPTFPPALYADGFTRLAEGSYDEAIRQFRDAADRDALRTAAGDGELTEIAARMGRGELRGALARLETAVQDGPDRSERRRLLAALYDADDQIDRSIEHLRAAVRLAPGDERSRLALADAYVAAGRDADAERVLHETIERMPESAQAHYRLGQLYQSLNRYAEALRAFEAAAQSHPLIGREQLYRLIGGLRLQEADIDGALAAHRREVALNPNDAEAHRALGDVYARAGRYDEALAEFSAALLIRPRDPLAHASRAQAYLSMADYGRAERAARRAVEIDPTLLAARYALGTALARLGRVAEGAAELEEFRRLQSAAVASERRELEIKLLQQSAWASAERGDFDDAAARLQQAVSLRPDSADGHLSLAVILKRAARYQEALSSLTRAAELGAGPDVHRHLAEVSRALGQVDEARRAEQMYERAKADRLRSERR